MYYLILKFVEWTCVHPGVSDTNCTLHANSPLTHTQPLFHSLTTDSPQPSPPHSLTPPSHSTNHNHCFNYSNGFVVLHFSNIIFPPVMKIFWIILFLKFLSFYFEIFLSLFSLILISLILNSIFHFLWFQIHSFSAGCTVWSLGWINIDSTYFAPKFTPCFFTFTHSKFTLLIFYSKFTHSKFTYFQLDAQCGIWDQ